MKSKDTHKRNMKATIPRPQPVPEGMMTLKGDEFTDAMRLVADPKAWSKDILFLRASRAASTLRIKDTHFTRGQFRAIAWFALFRELSIEYPVKDEQGKHPSFGALMKENEEYKFWQVWEQAPDIVLALIQKIRESFQSGENKHVEKILTNPKLSASGSQPLKKAVTRAHQRLKQPERVTKFAAKLRGEV